MLRVHGPKIINTLKFSLHAPNFRFYRRKSIASCYRKEVEEVEKIKCFKQGLVQEWNPNKWCQLVASADRGSLGRGRELSTLLLCPGTLLLLQGGEKGQWELEDPVPKMRKPS